MRRRFLFNMPILLLCLLVDNMYLGVRQTMAAAPITPSGLNTQVTLSQTPPPGKVQYDITGGTRPGGGVNLFHSFGNFNVPTNNIANFLNSGSIDLNGTLLGPNLPTSNILGRINGGNPSSIFGMIQTNGPGGFPTANLFLMNPNGFLFGPTATINVGGMVAFTTADYLRHTDNTRFNAVAGPADVLLTAAPVAAFGFLGNNPAAIAIQGSTLQVAQGQSLSLVGGNQGFTATNPDTGNPIPVPGGITITGGNLSAPGGQINIASVASPGEVVAGTLAYAPNVNGQSFGPLGSINISQQSVVDVSGNGGGTVSIRSGQFVLDNSTILAQVTGPGPVTNGVEVIGGGVDIQVSQDAVIQNGALIDTSVVGNATPGVQYGGVHVKADGIQIIGSQDFVNAPFTGIQSNVAQGSTGGDSGDINLEANSILIQDLGTFTTGIQSVTQGAGNTGNITLKASDKIQIDGAVTIQTFTGDVFGTGEDFSGSGNAGNIQFTSTGGNILMTNGPFITSQSFASTGTAGSITVSAPAGDIVLAGVPNQLFAPGSLFTVSDVENTAGSGPIRITAKNLTLTNAAIDGDNFSPFVPGNITVTLSGSLKLDGQNLMNAFNHNLSNTFIETVARGPARSADVLITAHDISLTNGSFLSTRTVSSGNGGSLNISTDNLQLTSVGQIRSGSEISNPRRPKIPTGAGGTVNIQGLAGPATSVLIDGANSGIFTNAQGTGAAGNTNISAQSVTIQNGGTITAATSGTAPSATGGDINIHASGSVTMTNGGSISSSSTGPGSAGNIQINAGNQFAMTNSSVTTEANQSSGGTIKISTNPNGIVELTNSTISASVLDGSGGGGSVNIDPQSVLLQNSQILANAVFGPGGNINITTNLLLPDANSIISASSQFGQQGTITIQSPIAPASRIIQLSQKPLIATSLLTQRCAALAGGNFSSFTVAGRDSLPAEPGGWLSSPLRLAISETGGGTVIEAGMRPSQSEPTGETPVLSLRRIAPPGFLTQAFAVDWSAGCTS